MKYVHVIFFTFFCILSGNSTAKDYFPKKTLTFITPFAPGNGPDVLVRALANEIGKKYNIGTVVESKPGASSFLATQAAIRSPADGYTILVSGTSTLIANRFLFNNLPYDPDKDLENINILGKGPLILLANNKVDFNDLNELVSYAKNNPGKITIGDSTAQTKIASAVLKNQTGIMMTQVPYRSTTHALPELIGGQIDLLITDLTAMNLVNQGKLKALAITGENRNSLAPSVKTFSEQKVSGLENLGFTLTISVPAGTPKPIIKKLNEITSIASDSEALKSVHEKNGTQPLNVSPDQMAHLIKEELKLWENTVNSARIKKQ